MNKTFLEKNNYIIAFHEATTGLAYDLKEYLLRHRIKNLLFISHPLLYLKDSYKKSSRYEYYKNGKLVEVQTAFHWLLPEQILYIKDILYTIGWVIKTKENFSFFIGIGNLNAFTGIILRFLGKVHTIVYYVIDYVPNRFSNRLINTIYHRIEKYAALHANWTWNLSPRMISAREEKWNMQFPCQLVVPHGVAFHRVIRVPFNNIHRTEIVYMGVLLKKQGIQLAIESLPFIKKKIPTAHFTIIGKGPFEGELKALVEKYKVENYVTFLGYIASHEEIEKRIAKAALAVALYNKKFDEFSYYADPGKIKNYLGAGVPVIMTNVPYVANQVEKAKCGFVISYDKKKFSDIVISFLGNISMMKAYRANAAAFAKNYDWENVYNKAFASMSIG